MTGGNDATKSQRKVLRSSPWAHHSNPVESSCYRFSLHGFFGLFWSIWTNNESKSRNCEAVAHSFRLSEPRCQILFHLRVRLSHVLSRLPSIPKTMLRGLAIHFVQILSSVST